MACSRPNLGGYSRLEGFKFLGPRFAERDAMEILYDDTTDLPCGKCELCRVDIRYSKALRIMLEAESWPEKSYFITLTFNNENLGNGELDHNEWAQFLKNFRQKFCQAKYCLLRDRGGKRHGKEYSKTFKKIKQVMCGEYGDTFGRKHFHGIIFNHNFSDLRPTGFYSKKGHPLHTSDSLRDCWSKGTVEVEPLTMDLALYVSAYVTDVYDEPEANHGHQKKQYGRFGHHIGKAWVSQYWKDVLVTGRVHTLEAQYPAPRYFLEYIKKEHPIEFAAFKVKKKLQAENKRAKCIEKGDGLLARAKAKARIFQHLKEKRRIDYVHRQKP